MKHLVVFMTVMSIPGIFSAQTTLNGSFVHNGLVREYSAYIPATYNAAEPVPLVLNLHGYTSVNWQQDLYTDFKPLAESANFIVVHPNGTLDDLGNRFWNVGWSVSNVDDVGFLLALVDSLSANYSIDQNRIYSTGMSNGGFMSYKLACETDRFAAVASVTGSFSNQMEITCNPPKPTPVMEIHGTADDIVPYNGSDINLPVIEVVNYWVDFNNCGSPVVENLPNTNTTDGATAVHYVYGGGDNGVTVEHYKVIGGGHTWPGAAIGIGVTCQDFSATAEIWRFFSQFSLGTGIKDPPKASEILSLFPNPASDVLHLKLGDRAMDSVEILDVRGASVMKKLIGRELGELDIRSLPEGFYEVKVYADGILFTASFIK